MKDDVLDDPLLPTAVITADRAIGDRALRKQVQQGRFPPPCCNICGKNYWRASVYRDWKAAALSGKFARVSHLARSSEAAAEPGEQNHLGTPQRGGYLRRRSCESQS